jgi:chemotaxis receptor (MCP) glutamine deamidase CheD
MACAAIISVIAAHAPLGVVHPIVQTSGVQVARVMEALHAGANVLVAIQRADDNEGHGGVGHLLLTVSEIAKHRFARTRFHRYEAPILQVVGARSLTGMANERRHRIVANLNGGIEVGNRSARIDQGERALTER